MEPATTPSKFAVLMPSQRRLAHFRTIVVRNLVPASLDTPVEHTFFRVIGGGGKVVYESEAAPDAANPVWLPMPSREARAHEQAHEHCLEFRVYSVPVCPHKKAAQRCAGRGPCPRAMAASAVATEFKMDLRKLMHLSLNLREVPLSNMPLNTVIVQLVDGFYGSQELWLEFRRRRLIMAPTASREPPAVLTVHECFGELRKIMNEKEELRRLKKQGTELEARVRAAVAERCAKEDKAVLVAEARERVRRLRETLSAQRAEAHKTRAEIGTHKTALVARARTLKRLLSQATPDNVVRKTEEADVDAERGEYFMARQLLTGRQLCMVSDVKAVYPIVEVERHATFSIRGVNLPIRDLPTYDEVTVSTGLGHTAHLVTLLAKYLQVPLRYMIRNMGSRSTIRDVLRKEHELPLYFKGQDKTRFELGVRFLELDIIQLLEGTGLHVKATDRSHMLAKMQRLFRHLLGPVLAFESQA